MQTPFKPSLRLRLAWRVVRLLATLAVVMLIISVSGCMERLFYYPEAGPTPPPRQFRGAESVWFTSTDGTRLHGWFIPAQNAVAKGGVKFPTVLHVHGNAGNIESH